jgi:hypothetical protein
MSEQNFRKYSRLEWTTATGEPDNEQLTVGCLQRIADATERMAINHTLLMDELDRYKNLLTAERIRVDSRDNTIRGLRGQITKLKARK